MGFINQASYDKIIAQNKRKNIINNKYLTDVTDPNFLYIKGKFFYNEQDAENKCKLFNVGSGLGLSIASSIADRVGKPVIGLSLDTWSLCNDMAALNFGIIGLKEKSYRDSELEFVVLDAENYWNDNGTDKVLTHYIQTEGTQTYHYWLVKEYYRGRIETKLYKNLTEDPVQALEVPLNSLLEAQNEKPSVPTPEGDFSIFVVGDYFASDFSLSTGWIGEPSLIGKSISTIYACDRYAIMFDTQYLQHTEQWRLFKGVQPELTNTSTFAGQKTQFTTDNKPSTNNTLLSDPNKTGKNLISTDVQADIKVINNDNPLVAQAREHYKEKIQILAATLGIPAELLWAEIHQGQIGAESRTIMQEPFISLINGFREKIDIALKVILPIVAKRNKEIEVEYVRPDIYMQDRSELLDQLKKEKEEQMSTRVRRIMQYYNCSKKKAETIIKEIDDEIAADAAKSAALPPTPNNEDTAMTNTNKDGTDPKDKGGNAQDQE